MTRLFVLLLCACVLSACGSRDADPNGSPTPQPTPAASPGSTPTPTPTPSATPAASPTPAPSASPIATPAASPTINDDGERIHITQGEAAITITRSPWHLSLEYAGEPCLAEAQTGLPDPAFNPDFALYDDRYDGIDAAYPGLPDISYQPLAFRTDAWHAVTAADTADVDGTTVRIAVETSDDQGGEVTLRADNDGAVELHFTPAAAAVSAVAESFDAPLDQRYFGGGQRFHGLNQRGKSLPLWISHGPSSDRSYSTNEIAASFFWTPSGWGAWAASDARGEINFAVPTERADALNLIIENDHLDLVLYCGTPQQIVSAHTARAGRPQWQPPDWMWEPMVWQDSDTTTETVRALVDGMLDRNIPLGAVWLDNPWDAGKASFDFDPNRFADPGALIREVHDKGVRFMVWLSPFVTGEYETFARERDWVITGTRTDNQDATYYDLTNAPDFGRGIDPHLDFTNPAATAWWRGGLEALIARGVDGVKVDRGEEDLSDDSVWANGLPNRLNHNAYVRRYHQAIFDAFSAQRPNGDFAIFARGGWNGSAQWAGHWAADNLSGPGPLGLGQALNSLLTLSVSGFPFNGADIGGYAGTRQDAGEAAFNDPLQLPTESNYMRWTQLGALSPIMQTPIPPWWVSDRAIDNYRVYAGLHHRLVPYIARAARAAIVYGIPIVQPLPYAFPADPAAVAIEDQYLFGPDLLVAPVTSVDAELPVTLRPVYLPAGGWTDFWTGTAYNGPTIVPVVATADLLPLFVREGAILPADAKAERLLLPASLRP